VTVRPVPARKQRRVIARAQRVPVPISPGELASVRWRHANGFVACTGDQNVVVSTIVYAPVGEPPQAV